MEAMVMRRESVVRGEVLNVWWTTLVVHVLALDYREHLGSGGGTEWCKVWLVMWGMVPVNPWARCLYLITRPGSSMCMWPKAGYMHFCALIVDPIIWLTQE